MSQTLKRKRRKRKKRRSLGVLSEHYRRHGRVVERRSTQSEGLQTDEKKGIIFGVKVLGATSLNGYEYSPRSMRDAARLYEGITVQVEHDDGEAEDSIGVLKDSRYERGAVYADWHLNRKHRLYEKFMEDAQKFPRNISLSHEVDDGEYTFEDGPDGPIIESIKSVMWVSVVRLGGTNKGLKESKMAIRSKKRPSNKTRRRRLTEREELRRLKQNPLVRRIVECACAKAAEKASRKKESELDFDADSVLQEEFDAVQTERDDLKSKNRVLNRRLKRAKALVEKSKQERDQNDRYEKIREMWLEATSELDRDIAAEHAPSDRLLEQWVGLGDDELEDAIAEKVAPLVQLQEAAKRQSSSDGERLGESIFGRVRSRRSREEDEDELDSELTWTELIS